MQHRCGLTHIVFPFARRRAADFVRLGSIQKVRWAAKSSEDVLFLMGALLLYATTLQTHAATVTVTNTNDSGPGSLRQAVADANDGDTITFAVSAIRCLVRHDNGGPTLTHMPLPGSPAIDAGDPNFTPPPLRDQRGVCFHRVFGRRIDVGSVETQPQPRCPTPAPRPTPH
jgi:hypothetical protein